MAVFTVGIASQTTAATSAVLAATGDGVEVFCKGLVGDEKVYLQIETTAGVYEDMLAPNEAKWNTEDKYQLYQGKTYLLKATTNGVPTNFKVRKTVTASAVQVLVRLT